MQRSGIAPIHSTVIPVIEEADIAAGRWHPSRVAIEAGEADGDGVVVQVEMRVQPPGAEMDARALATQEPAGLTRRDAERDGQAAAQWRHQLVEPGGPGVGEPRGIPFLRSKVRLQGFR